MAKNKPTEKVGQALTSIEKNSVKSGSMENNMMAKDALKQNSSSLPKARENTFDGSTSTGVESKVNYPFGKPEPDQEPLKKTYDKVVEEIKQLSQSGDQFQNDMRSVHNHSQDEVANHLQGLHKGLDHLKGWANSNPVDTSPNLRPSDYVRRPRNSKKDSDQNAQGKTDQTKSEKQNSSREGSQDKTGEDKGFFEEFLTFKKIMTLTGLAATGVAKLGKDQADARLVELKQDRKIMWDAHRNDYLNRYWYRPYKHTESIKYADEHSPPKPTMGDVLKEYQKKADSFLDKDKETSLTDLFQKGPFD